MKIHGQPVKIKFYIHYATTKKIMNFIYFIMPRSNNPARKRPVPWYSRDFMEAVFLLNGSGDRIRSVPPGTDSWVEFLALSGRVSAGNCEFPEGFRRKFMEYCFRNHRPGKLSSVVSDSLPKLDYIVDLSD